mgnify:CR=1 FL=1
MQREEEVEDRLVGGGGSGGQKVDKTSWCVYLKKTPSGIEVMTAAGARLGENGRLHFPRALVEDMFDTMWATRILGKDRCGLANVLASYFEVKQNKKYHKANWCKRPLRSGQLRYAAIDVLPVRGAVSVAVGDRWIDVHVEGEADRTQARRAGVVVEGLIGQAGERGRRVEATEAVASWRQA